MSNSTSQLETLSAWLKHFDDEEQELFQGFCSSMVANSKSNIKSNIKLKRRSKPLKLFKTKNKSNSVDHEYNLNSNPWDDKNSTGHRHSHSYSYNININIDSNSNTNRNTPTTTNGTGFNNGTSNATNNCTNNGTNDGTHDGTNDGTNNGTNDGTNNGTNNCNTDYNNKDYDDFNLSQDDGLQDLDISFWDFLDNTIPRSKQLNETSLDQLNKTQTIKHKKKEYKYKENLEFIPTFQKTQDFQKPTNPLLTALPSNPSNLSNSVDNQLVTSSLNFPVHQPIGASMFFQEVVPPKHCSWQWIPSFWLRRYKPI
jgi:hypothetical protein